MAWAEVNGVSLRYELSGGGRGSVVLLHEMGGSLESFDVMAPVLAGAFRVLRFDQRGAGQSEKPRAPFGVADQAADLAALIAAVGLEPPYHVAGMAAGAAVAVTFALAERDRVAALALCAPALSVAAERRQDLADRAAAVARDGMRAIADATLDRSYPPALRTDAALYGAYRARFLAQDPVGYGNGCSALAGVNLMERLGELTQPCLLLAGRLDRQRPAELVRAAAELIPDARFDVVEGGHLLAVQGGEALALRLRDFFLDPKGAR